MSRYRSGKKNHAYKLLRQVVESDFEFREYGVPRIRYKSYRDAVVDLVAWDTPHRTNWRERSWKKHRKTQHKT